MEREYINKKRYEKKSNKKNIIKPNVSNKTKSKEEVKTITPNNNNKPQTAKKTTVSKGTKKSKNIFLKKKRYKILRISFYLFIICLLAVCLRLILKDKYSPFLPTISSKKKENIQVINIAEYGLEDLSSTRSNNIVLSELEKHIYPMLLTFDSEYNIKYEVIKDITKVSNTEYVLNINPSFNITASTIKSSIEENMLNTSKYYFKTKNIDNIFMENETAIRIILKQSDPMYIYNLNLPIYTNSTIKQYIIQGTNDLLTLNRSDTANISLPKQITFRNANDLSKAVDMFKAGTIDVFFSSYLNVESLLGKYEYNIKAINSGNSLFLLGNPNSNLFNKSEIRKAITYGLNKNEIISEAINKNGISIDIPYVYNNQKYKYDIYAAENILLSNGYKKNKGVYEKYENGNHIYLELNILVNKDSAEKNAVANIIKRQIQDIGIKVNIYSISEVEINQRIKDNSYDLVLADINLNENPDISKLYDHIKVNENINKKIDVISNSNPTTINQDLKELIKTISDDVAIIGIYSKPTYIIYKKDITIFENPKFYNIFENFN